MGSAAVRDPAVSPAVPRIESVIFNVRGHRVMLSHDLALLYEIPTKVLLQAVRRNLARFPADFAFQLTAAEFARLRSQFVTSNRGGVRYRPYAFTEQGVALMEPAEPPVRKRRIGFHEDEQVA